MKGFCRLQGPQLSCASPESSKIQVNFFDRRSTATFTWQACLIHFEPFRNQSKRRNVQQGSTPKRKGCEQHLSSVARKSAIVSWKYVFTFSVVQDEK